MILQSPPLHNESIPGYVLRLSTINGYKFPSDLLGNQQWLQHKHLANYLQHHPSLSHPLAVTFPYIFQRDKRSVWNNQSLRRKNPTRYLIKLYGSLLHRQHLSLRAPKLCGPCLALRSHCKNQAFDAEVGA